MKSLKIAFAGAGLALLSSAGMAQQSYQGTDSDQFLKAVQERDGSKATQLISGHPTIVDTRDGKGDTGLIISIRAGAPDWTGFLLHNGADPNLAGAGGDTPLIAAAKAGFDDAADWLMDMGAKIDTANRSGETALIVAVQQRDSRLVKKLLEEGANPDHTDSVAGYSARDYATRDARAREILRLINEKKPKAGSTAAN